WMLAVALKVNGVTPLATPAKVIMKSVPPLGAVTGVVQARVIVARPASRRLTVGALHGLVTGPSWTSGVAPRLAMRWANVELTATPARPVTGPMLMGTDVVPPTPEMVAFVGRLTATPNAAETGATRRARAPPTT